MVKIEFTNKSKTDYCDARGVCEEMYIQLQGFIKNYHNITRTF